ncbi:MULTISPECIES: response regulator [Pseudoalteromonas]|uniref:DNA-binding response regulator in two-component regulatory system with BaeS n=1 Tax=Pseudoalteromonas carrageenovora IAM 12662 TaxID=1314868 RepID=A0A2K4X7C9_PSEVC|nr:MULTISPECIES: response regulator [Pseudoalteromonas]KTF17561.1 two-component system response regulator [Pseudoalteromonas sp. H103]MBE0382448.1 two-component system, OmpR family, response regulator BaeR [Pseudoalteromonas carrageenovora IAM 12662]MCQ8890153.1 response regulator [Pseudoalteromonas carrageenovora]MDO6464004.1 response regulator [Pseudoalteromonas carrageenovora]MDO6547429.1 response regulator [Pseudoalteromonas carrageenovora]
MEDQILIVEDEIKLAHLMSDFLTSHHYATHIINHGNEVLPWLEHNRPSLILLDIMLPGQSGIELCKAIRKFSNVPIIMVSAKVEEIDRLLGLELGADDYICKPFSYAELVARVKAILRRLTSITDISSSTMKLDESTYSVQYKATSIELTNFEFQLFKPLFNNPNRIFSRDSLMDTMYADQRIVSHRTIDSHIKKLRKKLDEVTQTDSVIQSVYGVGYRFVHPQ